MALANQSEMIFKKVALSEKKNLFRELASDRAQVAVKGAEADNIFHLIAVQVEKDEKLLCHLTADSKEINKAQKVTVNFPFGTERYFFQTDLHFESGWAVVDITVDLFQLQRRTNARFELPEKYDAGFIMIQHEGKAYFVDCKLKDISAGGFKMEVPGTHPDFRVGEVLKGTLRLGNRRPMEFQIEVRFAQRKTRGETSYHLLGVQFLHVDHILENRLLSLMMDLQREIFLKYPAKT